LEDKQNPEKRAEFRELAKYLAIAKDKPDYADMGVGQTGFSLQSFDARIGEKKGKKITGNGGGDEINVMGVCVSMIMRLCFLSRKAMVIFL